MVDWNNTAMYWWDGAAYVKVTDHNRAPVDVDFERIERRARMVNGTLRKYVVTKKRIFSTSWEMLPSKNGVSGGLSTVDGGLAGEDIESFHNLNDGAFNVQFRDGAGNVETVLCMFSEFNKNIIKRGLVDFWNLTITLEEV